MDALLFHNPHVGSGDHSKKDMLEILSGFRVTYCSTKGPDFKAMLKETADMVVVAGGDGTVRKVITGIVDRAIPIAILPLGTANNLATSLGIVRETGLRIGSVRICYALFFACPLKADEQRGADLLPVHLFVPGQFRFERLSGRPLPWR
jgi:hypothetical protein